MSTQVNVILFLKVGGSRVQKPSDTDGAALYDKANGLAATWITIAAGDDHSETCEPFLETGDAVGMYDVLKAKFSFSTSTTRHNAIESFFSKWKKSLPAVGTDWNAEFHALDATNKALKAANKDKAGNTMSFNDLVNEISLYTLMHRIESTNSFHQKMVSGLKDQEYKWSTMRQDLVHHMEVVALFNNAGNAPPVQHANLTQQIPSNISHGGPSRGSSPAPLLTPFGQDMDPNEQANSSTQIRCYCCGGPHVVSTCQYVKMGQQLMNIPNARNMQVQNSSFGHGGQYSQNHNKRGGQPNRGRGCGTYIRKIMSV
ncbi:hypothetical protein FRC19_006953 [Serendipita sp. 401]|nr:hypothetical protein FRC19_006953 [Serendipita sp. 401]KAG9026532.1 hypothetical protein FS842_005050 [Serendipita sp. 407]